MIKGGVLRCVNIPFNRKGEGRGKEVVIGGRDGVAREGVARAGERE